MCPRHAPLCRGALPAVCVAGPRGGRRRSISWTGVLTEREASLQSPSVQPDVSEPDGLMRRLRSSPREVDTHACPRHDLSLLSGYRDHVFRTTAGAARAQGVEAFTDGRRMRLSAASAASSLPPVVLGVSSPRLLVHDPSPPAASCRDACRRLVVVRKRARRSQPTHLAASEVLPVDPPRSADLVVCHRVIVPRRSGHPSQVVAVPCLCLCSRCGSLREIGFTSNRGNG